MRRTRFFGYEWRWLTYPGTKRTKKNPRKWTGERLPSLLTWRNSEVVGLSPTNGRGIFFRFVANLWRNYYTTDRITNNVENAFHVFITCWFNFGLFKISLLEVGFYVTRFRCGVYRMYSKKKAHASFIYLEKENVRDFFFTLGVTRSFPVYRWGPWASPVAVKQLYQNTSSSDVPKWIINPESVATVIQNILGGWATGTNALLNGS